MNPEEVSGHCAEDSTRMCPWRSYLDQAMRAYPLPVSRYAQLATLRPDGRPANRTVVVRGLLDPGGLPLITTDARSAKATDLAARSRAELCWLFGETREQFRLLGRVSLVGPDDQGKLGEERRRVWSELPEPSRRSFAWPAPGAPLAEPAEFEVTTPEFPPRAFVLMVLDPEWVEHLDLRPQPHARTRFVREGQYEWTIEHINP